MISLIWNGGSRCNVKWQQRTNIDVHASLTSKLYTYVVAVSGSCNECDIVELDIYDLSDVCCLLTSPGNAF